MTPTSVTIRERGSGFSSYPGAAASAHRRAGLGVHGSADRFAKLTLMAANSSIWLYVTAALGLAA